MPAPFGTFRFPGIVKVVGGTYGLSHGISPGTVTLECAPQPFLESGFGDVWIEYAGISWPVRNCKVVDHTLNVPNSGARTWRITLADRRWKWAFGGPFGPLVGHYNLLRPDGSLDRRTEATPQQLCLLCLAAMGEQTFDVSDVPNDSRPLVEWEGENPAQALQDLCDTLGCRVVMRLDDINSVAVKRLGIGNTLYLDGNVLEASGTIKPPIRPDTIRVICGKTRFQIQCLLEAVGLDRGSGSDKDRVKLLADLSYKPAASAWTKFDLDFSEVIAGEARELAQKTVYRWYRLKMANGDSSVPLKVAGWNAGVSNLEQILPIEDVDCGLVLNTDGTKTPRGPIVYGVWHPATYLGAGAFQNTVAGTRYAKNFRINRELGIIEFEEQVYKITNPASASISREPAVIGVRIAASIRDVNDRHWIRFQDEIPVGDGEFYATGPQILRRDEIVLSIWDWRQDQAGNTPTPESNLSEVQPQCQFYELQEQQKYQLTNPQSATYDLWQRVDPDGAIQQVVYRLQNGKATMQVSRNCETSPVQETYADRRAREKVREDRLHDAKKQAARERARKQRVGEVGGGGAG
jgi:hypothetical protein